MGQQWMGLQQGLFPQRFLRENLELGEGGEEERDNDILRETFERTGASGMGKRIFHAGEPAWRQEAPFPTPVFVFAREASSVGAAGRHDLRLRQRRHPGGARPGTRAAGDRDVHIAGGGATILEYVNAGLLDEFSIALSPVLFGSGIRLFQGRGRGPRGPGAGLRGADAAGDPPDLRSPGAVTPRRSALRRGQQRGGVLDALSIRKGDGSATGPPAALLAGSRPACGTSSPSRSSNGNRSTRRARGRGTTRGMFIDRGEAQPGMSMVPSSATGNPGANATSHRCPSGSAK